MRLALALCVLSLALAACGAAPRDSTKGFTGPERSVAATVEDLESAARKNETARVCTKLFSARLLASLKTKGTNCEAALEDAFRDADSLDLTVDDITIRGAIASAKVTSGTGSKKRTDTLELEKAGATWRISSLTA